MTKTNLKTGKEVKFHRNSFWNRFNNYLEKMRVGVFFSVDEICEHLEQYSDSEVTSETVQKMISRKNTEFGKNIVKVPGEKGLYKKTRKPRVKTTSKTEGKKENKKPFSMTFTFNSLEEMNRFLTKVK